MGKRTVAERPGPIVVPRLVDPVSASVDERDEHLMLLEAARQALDVEWTETLASAEYAGDHDVMGFPSMVAYLKHRMGMAGGRAHRYVRKARAVLQHAATFSAWKHRQISGDEAELMFRAGEKTPDEYRSAEGALLELVGDGVEETKRVLDYWRSGVDRSGVVLDAEAQLGRRYHDVTRRSDGMVTGEYALPTLEGEALLTALDSRMPPPVKGDDRTISQRRADALGDLARDVLQAVGPEVGGERPHITVHVDIPALRGQPGGLHETADGFVIDTWLVSQLACDASVTRIVFGPNSEVLDVGRKTRVVPAGLRRAVIARDRHCVAPGCGRSAKWCDVHHIIPWGDGGETVITNLCLLCRYHHTMAHLELITIPDLEIRPSAGAARDGIRRAVRGP